MAGPSFCQGPKTTDCALTAPAPPCSSEGNELSSRIECWGICSICSSVILPPQWLVLVLGRSMKGQLVVCTGRSWAKISRRT